MRGNADEALQSVPALPPALQAPVQRPDPGHPRIDTD